MRKLVLVFVLAALSSSMFGITPRQFDNILYVKYDGNKSKQIAPYGTIKYISTEQEGKLKFKMYKFYDESLGENTIDAYYCIMYKSDGTRVWFVAPIYYKLTDETFKMMMNGNKNVDPEDAQVLIMKVLGQAMKDSKY